MLNRTVLFVPIFLILGIFILSCASGPTTPPEYPEITPANHDIQAQAPNHALLGYYNLVLDTETPDIEVISERNIDLHLNITNIINATLGLGVAIVPGETNLATGLIVFDMTFTHPFPLNPEFSAFDMKGIMITPGSMSVGPLVFADFDETRILNADGYSRWWNPTEFTTPGIFGYSQGLIATGTPLELSATVNPYKLFADALLAEDTLSPVSAEPIDSSNGRAVFKAGESNTRRYEMQFEMNPDIQLIFGYAIDTCWDVPDPNPPTNIPADFPINANSNEAFRIAIGEVANTLYYDDEAATGGGSLVLNINIQDWQGIFNGNIQDEISSITLMSPDLLASDVNPVFLSDSGSVAFYTANLTGLAVPTRPGINQVVVEVVSSDGTTYKQAVPPAPMEPVAAYQVYTVDVPVLNCEADANNDWLEAFEMDFGDTVEDLVCLPLDYRDFYYFEIPADSLFESGQVVLTCGADQTKVGVYNESQNLLSESPVSGGTATVNLTSLSLDPGIYYIRVYTSNPGAIGVYSLELTGTLTDTSPINITDVTPPDLYVYPFYMWLRNNILYSLGYGIWVYDMTNPSDPVLMYGETDPYFFNTIKADFNYPYCYYIQLDLSAPFPNYALGLIDYTDPANPVHHKSLLSINALVKCIAINSTHIYIGMDSFPSPNIQIYEYASSPLSPTFEGDYTMGGSVPEFLNLWHAEGPGTQLIVGGTAITRFLDVENPGAITDEGFIGLAPGWSFYDVAVDEPYVYILEHGPAIQVLEIFEQTGAGPMVQGTVPIPGQAYFVELNPPYAYISDGSGGISVCNVTDPLAPAYITSVPSVADTRLLTVENDKLVTVLQGGPFETYSLTVPDAPVSLGVPAALQFPGPDLIFEGDYIFAGDNAPINTLDVVDISDPANAYVVAENPLPFKPYILAKEGDLIAGALGDLIMLVNASDPMSMSLHITASLAPKSIQGLVIKDNILYIASINLGTCYIDTWDVTDPLLPLPYLTQAFTGTTIRNVKIQGNIMFMTVDEGIRMYSVSSPGAPLYLDIYDTPEKPADFKIRGQYMYIAMSGSSVLEIVDISDPLSPVHVGSEFSSYPLLQQIAVEGQYAYSSSAYQGLTSIQIYPPDNPVEIGLVSEDPFSAYRLDSNEGCLYKTTFQHGLRIFDLY